MTTSFPSVSPIPLNGEHGCTCPPAAGPQGRPGLGEHVFTFAVVDDRVVACYDIANPDKLTRPAR